MNKFLRNVDFLFPLLVGFLIAFQSFLNGHFDEVFIILFVAATFANTRWKYVYGNESHQKECEEVIKKRREDANDKRRWYEGYGVKWGSTLTGVTLITVIIFTLALFLYKKFITQDYLVAFCIAGLITFFLRVLRYLSRYFFLDALCGVIIVVVFVFFSKMS